MALHFKGTFIIKGALTRWSVLISCMATSIAVTVIMASLMRNEVPLSTIATMLFFYGVCLFTTISEILMAGLAERLTKSRGEKWVKEIDYVYLLLGSFGVIGALNRITFVRQRFEGADLIAPLLLVTAVVLRIVKTRAEIGGWNKLSESNT